MLDEDLEAVDGGGAGLLGGLQQRTAALAIDHVDDGLAGGEQVRLQGQVLEWVFAL